MITLEEDLQTFTVSSGVTFGNGHTIDTGAMDKLIYEVRWSLDAAPSVAVFNPLGTNDVANTPDTWIGFTAYPPNVQPDVANTAVTCTLQAAGRGIIVLRDMPRYVQMATYFSGSFSSGTITLRAYGCSV